MIFFKLFYTFFKIGLFTIGGGYAMLPLIQEEVINNGWLPKEEIVNFIAVSESTPGPFAVNISTYIGSVLGGEFGVLGSLFGSFCATLGVILPSFIIILIVARFYEKFKTNKIVAGCMTGLKPAVVGLIGGAILSIFLTVFLPEEQSLLEVLSYLHKLLFVLRLFYLFLSLLFQRRHYRKQVRKNLKYFLK